MKDSGATGATTPLRQAIPARNADAQMWVRHALALRMLLRGLQLRQLCR